jgi:hypothetical protein
MPKSNFWIIYMRPSMQKRPQTKSRLDQAAIPCYNIVYLTGARFTWQGLPLVPTGGAFVILEILYHTPANFANSLNAK